MPSVLYGKAALLCLLTFYYAALNFRPRVRDLAKKVSNRDKELTEQRDVLMSFFLSLSLFAAKNLPSNLFYGTADCADRHLPGRREALLLAASMGNHRCPTNPFPECSAFPLHFTQTIFVDEMSNVVYGWPSG